MSLHLEVIPDARWAEEVAGVWAERLASEPGLRMCLPTGSTPRPLYSQVARKVDFAAAMVFILDEFGLPDGDPGRCSAMLERDLLGLLQERPKVDRLDPTAPDSRRECARFAASVASGGLHLTLLGVGANGHLGLNEPGSTPESTTRRVVLSEQTRSGLSRYGVEGETDWGLTLGLKEILASEEIWLLVRGAHKAEVLSKALNGPLGSEFPVTFLREAGNVTVWADQSAAAQI